MDPTANLAEQLRIAARILQATDALADAGDAEAEHLRSLLEFDSARLAELVEALNGWISRGGFLPAQWTAAIQPAAPRTAEAAIRDLLAGLEEKILARDEDPSDCPYIMALRTALLCVEGTGV